MCVYLCVCETYLVNLVFLICTRVQGWPVGIKTYVDIYPWRVLTLPFPAIIDHWWLFIYGLGSIGNFPVQVAMLTGLFIMVILFRQQSWSDYNGCNFHKMHKRHSFTGGGCPRLRGLKSSCSFCPSLKCGVCVGDGPGRVGNPTNLFFCQNNIKQMKSPFSLLRVFKIFNAF